VLRARVFPVRLRDWESVLEGTVTDPPPVRLITCPAILKVWLSVLVNPGGKLTDPPSVRLMVVPEMLKVCESVLAKELRSTVTEVVVFSGRNCKLFPKRRAERVCVSVLV